MDIVTENKVFIKSKNTVPRIMNNYRISLLIFIVLSIIANILIGEIDNIKNLLISLMISFIITSIIAYIINIIKKEYKFLDIYNKDHVELIAIIIGIFGINMDIYIISLAILISLLIKSITKNIDISSSLYGILCIYLYKYFTNTPITPLNTLSYDITYKEILNNITDYLFNIEYIVPFVSLISLIYLFHKKAIKYNIIFFYIITIFTFMLIYSFFHDFIMWLPLYEIFSGGVIFLSTYLLSDYKNTPMTSEGCIIYGIILGLITSILRFIIPDFSVIIPLLIGPLILTNIIDKSSSKLKYNHKLYYGIIVILAIITIIGAIII